MEQLLEFPYHVVVFRIVLVEEGQDECFEVVAQKFEGLPVHPGENVPVFRLSLAEVESG